MGLSPTTRNSKPPFCPFINIPVPALNSSQSLQTYIRSNVDYIYFDNPPHIYCKIQETSATEFDFLRLDNDLEPLNHLDDYGLNCEG